MIYSSYELAYAAGTSDKRLFLNEISRYDLPITPKRTIRGSNRYDLGDVVLALAIGELKSYGFAMATAAELIKRIDLTIFRAVLDEFTVGAVDRLIICIPQASDLDDDFPTTLTSWQDFVTFAEQGCINSIPLDLTDIINAKIRGEF